MLDMSLKDLEKVLYCESYVVTDPGNTELKEGEVVPESKYQKLRSDFANKFSAGIGGEVVRDMLRKIDLQELTKKLRKELGATKSEATKKKVARRLKLAESFIESGNRPEWMMMEVVPVLPPDLRPWFPWTADASPPPI
jgi:DNA-directed RNA polymerase subunit beta'